MTGRIQKTAGFLVVSLVAASCHQRGGGGQQAAASPCQPHGQQAARDLRIERLNGNHDITFVARNGPRSGGVTRSVLMLRAQDPSLSSLPSADTTIAVTQSSIGRLEGAGTIEDVGATRMGDPTSSDSRLPGVGVYVTRRVGGDVTSVVVRVGSASNARGLTAFDSGHFTLFVQGTDEKSFWGSWTSNPGSGGMVQPDAGGYFCAVRAANG